MNRGRPLPWAIREQIRELRAVEGSTVRWIARKLGVNKDTVTRYAPKTFRGVSDKTIDVIQEHDIV